MEFFRSLVPMSNAKTETTVQLCANMHESINLLAAKLFGPMDKDTVFSPLSIGFIIALLHHGAVENTEKQLTNLLEGKMNLWI